MKQNPALKVFALLAVSVGLLPVNADALPMAAPQKPNLLIATAGDCTAVGEQVAAQQGGQLRQGHPDHAEWQGHVRYRRADTRSQW